MIIYKGPKNWKYYLCYLLSGDVEEVSEKEFLSVVGYNRDLVPMKYEKNNINRQNFYLDNTLIGYRERR